MDQRTVAVEHEPVCSRTSYDDQRSPDGELLSQVVMAVDTRRDLDAVEVRNEADRGVGRPVIAGSEGDRLAAVPVPRAHDRLGRGDLQGALDGRAVPDRPAECQDDGHA